MTSQNRMENLQFGMERVNLNTGLLYNDRKIYQIEPIKIYLPFRIRFLGLRRLKLFNPNWSLEYVAQNAGPRNRNRLGTGPRKKAHKTKLLYLPPFLKISQLFLLSLSHLNLFLCKTAREIEFGSSWLSSLSQIRSQPPLSQNFLSFSSVFSS